MFSGNLVNLFNQKQSTLQSWVLPVAILTLFLCIKFLFLRNMGGINELHHLPLSRHLVDPIWLAKDIYYSEPPGYRLLFQLLFGPLTVSVGFLATSIIGRILGYIAISLSLWALARNLGMRFLTLFLALGLFIHTNKHQGVMAGEWLVGVGGIEPKIFAYSAIFVALTALFKGRYLWMVAWLGLAISFHALVGGWTAISLLFWLLWRRRSVLLDGRRWLAALPIYGVTGVFAVTAVLTQLLSPVEESDIAPAAIYSFLRNPHHVNPLSWHWNVWLGLLAYVLVLVSCAFYVRWADRKEPYLDQQIMRNRTDFLCFVLCTLIPFGAGVLAAPIDINGQFLQYYPFRVGDVMVPLGTALFLALALDRLLFQRRGGAIALSLIVLLCFGAELPHFYQKAVALQDFPSEEQRVDPELKAMATWVKQHVPAGDLLISSPVDLDVLAWLCERPTVAKFRFVPSASSADVAAWYERITDLGGGVDILNYVDRFVDNSRPVQRQLREAYNSLDTLQMSALMDKYQSNYAITNVEQRLELPLLYENSRYRVYGSN